MIYYKLMKMKQPKFIVDVQDLWPEAFTMAIKNKFLQKFFYPMKRYIDYAYSTADCVVGVSQTYVDRVLSVNSKVANGTCVYLGNDAQLFDCGRNKYRIVRDDNEFWIGYAGSMGDSYDIECVINAIAIIQQRQSVSKQIRFILCGDGEKRKYFELCAKEKNVQAVFYGFKPYEEMAGIISSCDIVVNPIVPGSAASIINKVGDYALSGLPVINTQESVEYRNLIDEYKCGINCRCGDSSDVADAITLLASDVNQRLALGRNNRIVGERFFNRLTSYKELLPLIDIDSVKGKVIIIANFASRLDGTANGRFTYLAEMIASSGVNVEVITSTFRHSTKTNDNSVTGVYKSNIILIPEPGYSKNISLKRLYSHWVWGRNVRKYLDSLNQVPSVIYCAIPSLTVAVQAAKYCKKCRNL